MSRQQALETPFVVVDATPAGVPRQSQYLAHLGPSTVFAFVRVLSVIQVIIANVEIARLGEVEIDDLGMISNLYKSSVVLSTTFMYYIMFLVGRYEGERAFLKAGQVVNLSVVWVLCLTIFCNGMFSLSHSDVVQDYFKWYRIAVFFQLLEFSLMAFITVSKSIALGYKTVALLLMASADFAMSVILLPESLKEYGVSGWGAMRLFSCVAACIIGIASLCAHDVFDQYRLLRPRRSAESALVEIFKESLRFGATLSLQTGSELLGGLLIFTLINQYHEDLRQEALIADDIEALVSTLMFAVINVISAYVRYLKSGSNKVRADAVISKTANVLPMVVAASSLVLVGCAPAIARVYHAQVDNSMLYVLSLLHATLFLAFDSRRSFYSGAIRASGNPAYGMLLAIAFLFVVPSSVALMVNWALGKYAVPIFFLAQTISTGLASECFARSQVNAIQQSRAPQPGAILAHVYRLFNGGPAAAPELPQLPCKSLCSC